MGGVFNIVKEKEVFLIILSWGDLNLHKEEYKFTYFKFYIFPNKTLNNKSHNNKKKYY
jgi:hypothetical protein